MSVGLPAHDGIRSLISKLTGRRLGAVVSGVLSTEGHCLYSSLPVPVALSRYSSTLSGGEGGRELTMDRRTAMAKK